MLNIEEFAETGQLFDGHYALIRPLSVDGATADVWLALDTNTVTEEVQLSDIARLNDDKIEELGLMVAIKIYRPQNALDIEGEQRFRDEYMIVFNCHHTNLIHPTHFSIFKETPYLVLPYCKLGSSELLIGTKLSNDDIWKYILDVSSGLEYLHALTPPIIHQDIKPANILLDDTRHYAITDFGISAQRGGKHGFYFDEENSGTLAYMAPERFQEGTEPIPQSDIWAFGATLCEIITGKVPFGEEGGKNQMESNAAMPVIPNVSSDIQRLIHACLSQEPGDRPSAEQIRKAAEVRQYPVKQKKVLYGVTISLLMVVIASISYYLLKPIEKVETYQPTPEELYKVAIKKMNIDNEDSLKTGLTIMDSLRKMSYIPAIYQCAYTYGWYNEPESKRRKKILGIEMKPDGVPISDIYINKAIGLYSEIIARNDSSYGKELADAGYRLAWYYLEQYNNSKENLKKTRVYLQNSLKWATLANDSLLLQRTNDGLKKIDIALNDNNN